MLKVTITVLLLGLCYRQTNSFSIYNDLKVNSPNMTSGKTTTQRFEKETNLDSTEKKLKVKRETQESYECGKSLQLSRRILNGDDTEPHEFPWMAYMYEKQNGKVGGFFCGATIISDEWIVTAAHCMEQPNSPEVYKVVFGKHTSVNESSKEVSRKISEIVIHPKFSPVMMTNDIALLKINKKIKFNKYKKPICLLDHGFPTDATFEKGTFSGEKCIVLGWGESEKEQSPTTVLQKLNKVIIPHLICELLTSTPTSEPYKGRNVLAEESLFCAGGVEGKDTCEGDSGGPLMCSHDNGRYYLHGVTSYGPKPCGQKNKPGVYTRVADYRTWIDETISIK